MGSVAERAPYTVLCPACSASPFQYRRPIVALLSSPLSRLLFVSSRYSHSPLSSYSRHSVKPSADSPSRRACSGRASSSSGVTLRSGSRSSGSRRPSVRTLSGVAPPRSARIRAAFPHRLALVVALTRDLRLRLAPSPWPFSCALAPLKPLCLQTPTPSGR